MNIHSLPRLLGILIHLLIYAISQSANHVTAVYHADTDQKIRMWKCDPHGPSVVWLDLGLKKNKKKDMQREAIMWDETS